MLIEKYDEKPKFDFGFSPFFLFSYPLYNIQSRSVLYKYLNSYDPFIAYRSFYSLNNLNLRTYVIHIYNLLQQIYENEGIKGLYRGALPMLAHILSRKSIYYLLEKIHFDILKKKKLIKKKSQIDKNNIAEQDKEQVNEENSLNDFITDYKNYKIAKHINFVKDDNGIVKEKKKKKNFHLSFYHAFYDYVSHIVSFPLLNISTRLIAYQNNTKSLLQNFRNMIYLTYKYDGIQGFYRGLHNYLAVQSIDKILNCFLYSCFSNNCSYDKVIAIKIILSTCLTTVFTPFIHFSILNRAQSTIPGLCQNLTFHQFFKEFQWKNHMSNVLVGLTVAGIQLIIITLIPKDYPKNDELIDKKRTDP